MNTLTDNPTRTPLLGCIADDVTGATDLAINLVQGGMYVVQVLGVPSAVDLARLNADAIVVALKTRSIPKSHAVSQSLEALTALRDAGVQRYFFKYCSTFDSTAQGNIGPVAESLMNALEVEQTIFCPAFPRNGRTVYQGHLFVNGRLLNESGMEKHPLNPMTDANLVRYLRMQTEHDVGLLPYDKIDGQTDVRAHLRALCDVGANLVIADACDDVHLKRLADAVVDMPLVTGGSGIARYLPPAYRDIGLLDSAAWEPRLPNIHGRSLILSGSCSAATNRQVAYMHDKCPTNQLDVDLLINNPDQAKSAICEWARATSQADPLLIYSTSPPDEVSRLQIRHGADSVAQAIESFLASLGQTFVSDFGVRRLVLAGGETSGAVVNALGVRALRIGPEICAGVPWTESFGDRPLALALKSGNFGAEDFFATALGMLP